MPKNQQTDPRSGMARALAEIQVELQGAEHSYARLQNEGSDHMSSRYPAEKLSEIPGSLDHWAWHTEPMKTAQETAGIQETPSLPYATR